MTRETQARPSSRFGLDGSTRALIGRLWRDWLRRHLGLILAAVFFMVVTAAAGSTYPVVLKIAFDLMEGGGAAEGYPTALRWVSDLIGGEAGFYVLPAIIFLVTLVAGGANYFQAVLSNSFTLQTIRDLQNAMFQHLMRADMATLQTDRTGALMSRFMTDVNLMRDALGKALTGMARDLLKVVFLLAVMIYLNWQLTLAIAILFPIGARPILRIGRRMRRASGHVQLEAGELTSTLEEAFNGARFIKAYGLEEHQDSVAARTFQRLYEFRYKMVKGRARTFPVSEVFGGIAFGGVLAFAGQQILSGAATIGDFSGYLIALPMIYQPIRSVGNLNAAMQEGMAAAARVFALLDQRPKITDKPGAAALELSGGAAKISFQDIGFSYVEDTPALQDISFEVEPGATVALVGPSGAGKSTILHLVPRFYDVDYGALMIDGQDIRDVTQASLRAHIALVSQDVTLFNDTIAANIRFGRMGASDEDVIAAATAAAAHDFIMALPDGYETNVGDRGMTLSGGERQRLSIARAMLKDAPILLLDEATSALDAESEHQVQEALARLAQGRTTIVIAHRLATVMGADRIYVLDQGRIVETGRHDELRAAGGLYERLCQLQFRTDLNPVDGGTTDLSSPSADTSGPTMPPRDKVQAGG